jgi:hypothetical protein
MKKGHDKYLVHYLHFSDEENEWVPLAHLRMRCRTSSISDCCEIYPWKDVCVMTRHPHSEDKSPVRLIPHSSFDIAKSLTCCGCFYFSSFGCNFDDGFCVAKIGMVRCKSD